MLTVPQRSKVQSLLKDAKTNISLKGRSFPDGEETWHLFANWCNGIEGRTEIAVAIAGQSHSRKNFRKLNYKMNGRNRKGLHRIKELSYSSLRLTEIESQRIIE